MGGINGAVKSAGIKRALAKRDGQWCWFCGVTFPDLIAAALPDSSVPRRSGVTIDHYVPVSMGGSHRLRNLRLACGFCNGRKGNLSAEEFETSAVLQERRRLVMRAELKRLGFLPTARGYLHPATFIRVSKGFWQCPLCQVQAPIQELTAVPCRVG